MVKKLIECVKRKARQTVFPIWEIGKRQPSAVLREKPEAKKVDLAELPFTLEAKGVRLRYQETDSIQRMPTCANYILEMYVDGEWKVWPYVQSFTFSVDVHTRVPKVEVVWIDNLREKK